MTENEPPRTYVRMAYFTGGPKGGQSLQADLPTALARCRELGGSRVSVRVSTVTHYDIPVPPA